MMPFLRPVVITDEETVGTVRQHGYDSTISDPVAARARVAAASTLLESARRFQHAQSRRGCTGARDLAKHHGTVRGLVTLLHDNGELQVEARMASTCPRTRMLPPRRRHHRQSGESSWPIVVPRVSRAGFQPRGQAPGAAERRAGFICVLILLNRRGGRARRRSSVQSDRDYERYVKFLGIAASTSQVVKIQRLVEEDKKRLVDENTHLRQSWASATIFRSSSVAAVPSVRFYEQMAQVAATNTTVLIRASRGRARS
jgi:Nif-specific regulatory protein